MYKEYIVRIFHNRIEWYNKDKKLHRDDGPAVEFFDGYKAWWVNGELHREDGPAIVYSNGRCSWWLNGKEVKKEKFIKLGNKQYKLMEI